MDHHIHSNSSVAPSSLHIDLQTYEQSQDSNVGTCTILRHFSSRIPGDFVLVPCDLIPPPSLPLSSLVDKFRVDSTSDGSIATTCWFAHKPENGAFPEEWGPDPHPVPIVWDDPSGTLLHIDTPDDQDRNGEELELPMSLLSRFVHCIIYRLLLSLILGLVFVAIRDRHYPRGFGTRMYMSAGDLSWMCCMKRSALIPLGKNSSRGC